MVALMKLRIKFGSGGAEKAFQKIAIINGCSHKEENTEQPTGEVIFSANPSRKRGPDEVDEIQTKTKKKQKIDRNVFRQCSSLLKSMKEHRFGWVFNEPVDPVKLNIPDYFSVISKPMDFSTIERKLVKNGYDDKEEFAADVRLTFSNAMLYNPPDNMVHTMAKELNEFFEVRWKSLERKYTSEVSKVVDNLEQRREMATFPGDSPVSTSKPLEEKARKFSLSSKPVEEKTEKRGLKKLDQGHLATRSIAKCWSKVANGCGQHDPAKGAPKFGAGKCGSCGKTACICLKSVTPLEDCVELDITLERSCRDKGSEASAITTKSSLDSQASKSDLHSDESVCSMNEENGCQSSQPQKPPNSLSSDKALKTTPVDVPLSPKKALRAAMLKSRFADTILKAKQIKVLDNGNSIDPIKLQREKERLERMQREEKARIEAEKARIEAEVRAAEAASRMRKETELKMERERQRLALEKMEETAKMEEEKDLRVEREMKKLFGSAGTAMSPRFLEKLGLFMKQDDHLDDIESESSVLLVDVEEGEIF